MNPILQALPLPTLPSLPLLKLIPTGAAARALRASSILLAAVAIPLGVLVTTPLVGALFVAVVLISPLVLVFALVQASIQAVKERRLPSDRSTMRSGGLAAIVRP